MRDALAGKRILVTGAARGLGRRIAEAAAEQGAQLVVTDILESELEQTATALKEQGAHVQSLIMNQAEPASIEAGFAQIAEAGALDGLVNNAAIATGVGGNTLMEYDLELWDRVMTVNVRGLWLTTKAAVPLLAQSGNGKIVNIASDTALWGAPKLMAYVASKGAVISMTRSMARELGDQGIAVNAIAPGLTHVEATEYVPQERYDYYQQGRAFKREQQPDDVDGTILYLLSDWANFVTGQLIPVNGGFVCR